MSNQDLLDLYGYRVLDIRGGYSRTVEVELTDPVMKPCKCGAARALKHGTRKVQFKDFPIQRMPTVLEVKRQRWRCEGCGAVLLEELPGIDTCHNMTVRFRNQVAEDAISRTFTDTATLNGIKESLVRRIFKEYADKVLDGYKPEMPRILGMDEKVIQGRARFVLGDVGARTMLDIQASRRNMDLEAYLGGISGRENVEVVTQDMYWGYKTINERYFRRAAVVIDKFHVVRYANLAVEMVRKQVQNSLRDEDRVSLKRKIRLLGARPANLNDDGRRALRQVFRDYPILETAVTVKEWFYDIYECDNRADAEKAYIAWLSLVPHEMERAFTPIIKFMKERRWRPLIFNYFEHPYTNAYVEALNGLIDQINRSGRGYNLETLRAKALLRYGSVPVQFSPMGWGDMIPLHVGQGIDLSTFESDLARDRF